jgi:hypothetical protein
MILVRIGASRGYHKSDSLIMLFPDVPLGTATLTGEMGGRA